MVATLIERKGNKEISFDSLVVSDPKRLSVLSNKLAVNILKELAKSPACAMDIARRLKLHEQKVYYHLRKLEKAGFVKAVSNEVRYGMVAKIYDIVAPVIATKIVDKGSVVKRDSHLSPEEKNFWYPFIDDGKLNAKIIFGDTVTHGRFEESGNEGPYASDIMLFIGRFLADSKYPNCKVDTMVREKDLKDNLILLGNNRTNIIIDKINDWLPVYFDPNGKEQIFSKITNKTYTDPQVGFICKLPNPFSKDRKILVLGNIARRGMTAISIALIQNLRELVSRMKEKGDLVVVVQGIDKDGDRIVDSVKILE